MAVIDFDKFNFAIKKFAEGTKMDTIKAFIPELNKKDLTGVSAISSDYDKFDIDVFYEFCRHSSIDGEDMKWAYPFVALENVNREELDEFIIGTWIKNHDSIESYQKQLDAISIH